MVRSLVLMCLAFAVVGAVIVIGVRREAGKRINVCDRLPAAELVKVMELPSLGCTDTGFGGAHYVSPFRLDIELWATLVISDREEAAIEAYETIRDLAEQAATRRDFYPDVDYHYEPITALGDQAHWRDSTPNRRFELGEIWWRQGVTVGHVSVRYQRPARDLDPEVVKGRCRAAVDRLRTEPK